MTSGPGEAQAKRLERVYEEVAKLLQDPGVASRLRTPPGRSEWSAMQALGHMAEMIPYWLNHCRTLIAAAGTPPAFAHPRVARAISGSCPRCERRPGRSSASATRGSSSGGERDQAAL